MIILGNICLPAKAVVEREARSDLPGVLHVHGGFLVGYAGVGRLLYGLARLGASVLQVQKERASEGVDRTART